MEVEVREKRGCINDVQMDDMRDWQGWGMPTLAGSNETSKLQLLRLGKR